MRHYLITLTAASMLTAVCRAVMPSGTVKRISLFTCSLLLFVVLVRPVLRTDYTQLLSQWESAYSALAVHDESLEATDFSLMTQLIAEQVGAYIESKGAEQGIPCNVSVRCDRQEGIPVPVGAEITGDMTDKQEEQLRALIEEEVGIPSANITFCAEEGGNP